MQVWCCQPRGDPETRGEGAVLGRGCLHPEPALPGVSMSTPCKPGGRRETPSFIRLPPHLLGKGFGSPHLVGGDPGVRATRGRRLPSALYGRGNACSSVYPSVCRSGWRQPCRSGRTKLSFLAEGRTRIAGKGWFWNLLLLTCRVGPGYLPRPLTRKTETRLQGVSWTVERADPLALLNVGGPKASVRAAPLSVARHSWFQSFVGPTRVGSRHPALAQHCSPAVQGRRERPTPDLALGSGG